MFYKTGRVEFSKSEFINKLFQWHTILHTNRNSNSKAVHHAAHGSAFLRHINKYFTECTITVFTCAKKDSLTINFCFLCKTTALSRQGTTFYNTCKSSFQLCIRGRLYSLLHFIQKFFYSQFAKINNV